MHRAGRLSQIVPAALSAAQSSGKTVFHLSGAIPISNPGDRGFTGTRGQPRRSFSSGPDRPSGKPDTASNVLVPYKHDLVTLASEMPTLKNVWDKKAGDPASPAMTIDQFVEGFESGQLAGDKPYKFGISSRGEIWISGVNAKGKQSGHIDLKARIDQNSARLVMAGMVTPSRDDNGRVVLIVGNQTGHFQSEGDEQQDRFTQAAFGQSVPQAIVQTKRFLGYTNAAQGSSYRQVPRDDLPLTGHAEQIRKVAEAHAAAVRIVAAPPPPSDS